jgi:hypothetical protein
MKSLRDVIGDRYRGSIDFLFGILLAQLEGYNRHDTDGYDFPVGCNFCGETICDLNCTGFDSTRPNILTLWLEGEHGKTS